MGFFRSLLHSTRPRVQGGSADVATPDLAPTRNRQHARYPKHEALAGRRVLEGSERARLAIPRRAPEAGRDRDARDYRLPKAGVAARLDENVERARAEGAGQADDRHFAPYPLESLERGESVALDGTLQKQAVRATVRNQVFENGAAVASTIGWEARSDQERAVTPLEDLGEVDVRIKHEMQDDWLIARGEMKLGGGREAVALHGVFDGHGEHGERAAAWARERLPQALRNRMEQFNPVEADEEDIYAALKTAFADLSRTFPWPTGGTTAVASMRRGSEIWIAGVGDSGVDIVTPGGHFRATEAAKLARGQERNRFTKQPLERGAFISGRRLDGVLAPLRSLGENHFGGKTVSRPKLTRYFRPPGETWHAIHMSDGMTDIASSRQICETARDRIDQGVPLEQVATELVIAALFAGSRDNITVMIVPFRPDANETRRTAEAPP